MPTNNALWLKSARADLTVGPAPYTKPDSHQVVVRVRAIAVNPLDRLMHSVANLVTPWLRYPFVLGADVAGEVVEVGAAVSRFKIGDRVLGLAAGWDKPRNNAAEGAYQDFCVIRDHMAAPIPDDLPFEAAAVLPLAVSTAASALFQKDFLGLDHPTNAARPTGKTLLVWSGSTSVGINAIQLAKAAGYDVVATASPKNFDYLKSLGASQVFDYRSRTIVADLKKVLRGRQVAGALAVGAGSAPAAMSVLSGCKGNRFVAYTTPPGALNKVPTGKGRVKALLPEMMRFMRGNVALAIGSRLKGVKTKFVWGSSLMNNEVGPMIFEAFLPQALAEKRYATAPEPLVVGNGLDRIPDALARLRDGASARKFVVTLG